MRERFQACCVDPDDSRAAQLNTWSHSLVSLRWEALVDFTSGLLELEPLLRQCWNKQKFLAGSSGHRVLQAADASTSEHSTSVAVEGINAALTSPAFWTGVALCHDVAFEAEFTGRWAEGCSCCRKPNSTCAYKGCRAAEFASGQWQQELKNTMVKNRAALGQYLVMSRDTDRAQYFSDWAKARARLWGGIQVKLGYWQQLPWRLCCFVCSDAFSSLWWVLFSFAVPCLHGDCDSVRHRLGALSHTNPVVVTSAAKACLQTLGFGFSYGQHLLRTFSD